MTMHFEPYNHQVAGHCCIVKLGGRVCKPLIPRECDFYHLIRKDLPQLIPFTAEFFGCLTVAKKKKNGELMRSQELSEVVLCPDYIILQDLTAGMIKPCVMDIKMGTRQRFTTSTTLGFRLCGMRVWRDDELYAVDRLFGRGLTSSSVETAVEAFLFNGYLTHTELIPSILDKLQRLIEVMENLPYRLYTSSLLFIYEGDARREGLEEDGIPPISAVDIRIVDFAHGIPKNTKEGESDDGFVFGLKNLIILFQNIMAKHTSLVGNGGKERKRIAFIEKISSNTSKCVPFISTDSTTMNIPNDNSVSSN